MLLQRLNRNAAFPKKLMGETHVQITVRKDADAKSKVRVKCVVDTGADLTVLPHAVLTKLGVKPNRRETLGLANGATVERDIGRVFVEFSGRGEYSPVVFGEPGDSTLLGVLTLEVLGLGVDPLRRELFPLDLKL